MEKKEDKKRIGILRGGLGEHYENSLAEGGGLISFIFENLADKYKPVDIFVDKEGSWHAGGILINPLDLPKRVDLIWNISHPNFSSFLKNLAVPIISVPSFSKVIGKSREMLEKHMNKIGVPMPRHFVIPAYQQDLDGRKDEFVLRKAKETHEKFPAPWIVRSFGSRSETGVHIAKTFPELIDAISDLVSHNESILVEELIVGKNVFMHTIADFRDHDIYSFPVYAGRQSFSAEEKKKLIEVAKSIHNHLGVPNYLKSNFVLNSKGDIFLTSVEFFPDLEEGSHLDKACASVGAKMHHVVENIIELA